MRVDLRPCGVALMALSLAAACSEAETPVVNNGNLADETVIPTDEDARQNEAQPR